MREDYYAWTWGDALFVVIDAFQYTMNLPYAGGAAGEGSDDRSTGDQWSWTLGQQQYDWLTQTLENSHAKYKFVFSHQHGGRESRAGRSPGSRGGLRARRGQAQAAGYFEWGGKNADGTRRVRRASPRVGQDDPGALRGDRGQRVLPRLTTTSTSMRSAAASSTRKCPSAGTMASGFGGVYSEGRPRRLPARSSR